MFFHDYQGADLLSEIVALRVMSESGIDANQLRYLHEASKHRQILMARAENGEPLASLTFARISKHTLRILAHNSDHKLRPYEYREGKILYIIDGFFRKSSFKRAMEAMAPELKKYRLIAYARKGRLRVMYNGKGSLRSVKLPNDWVKVASSSVESATDRE